jgi:hypothetical protein
MNSGAAAKPKARRYSRRANSFTFQGLQLAFKGTGSDFRVRGLVFNVRDLDSGYRVRVLGYGFGF